MAITRVKLINDIPYVPSEYGMIKDAEFTVLKRVKFLGFTTSVFVRALNLKTFKIEKKWYMEI